MLLPNVHTAIEQLWSNKMRSVLTVLGIVIAVASTITVVSVVRGFTGYVADFLQGLGTNAMWVWPYRPPGEAGKTLGGGELTGDDVTAVERGCSAIKAISPLIRQPTARLSYGREEVSVPLEGVSAAYHAIRNFPVESGRPFALVDVERSHNVCVLGREVMKKL